jgi:hypothetical protein
VIALICLCHWESGEAKAMEDTIDVKWIAESELDSFEFPPNVKGYIKKGFEAIKQ